MNMPARQSEFFGAGRHLHILEQCMEKGRKDMEIHGFQKTTLLDYPEHVAATVFVGGCNFRCPFCHNGGLVLDPAGQPSIPEEEVLAYLRKRSKVLEGVCITGGEPTLQADLATFVGKLKAMGYLVKLDTNGYRPEVLSSLLQQGLLDYVAMDIKASEQNYSLAAGVGISEFARIRESIRLLVEGGIPYEFRTTVVKGIHGKEEFEEIGKLLKGCRAYFLQGFQESDAVIADGYEAYSLEEMEQMANLARKYIDRVEVRGVE